MLEETARFKLVFTQDVMKLNGRACIPDGVVLSVRLLDTVETSLFQKPGNKRRHSCIGL